MLKNILIFYIHCKNIFENDIHVYSSITLFNRVGAFFFIVMNYVFGNMAAVDLFIKERALFV